MTMRRPTGMSMRTFARAIRAALVWMLALLASVQPILALDCQCSCKQPVSSPEKIDSSSSACDVGCGGKCLCHKAGSKKASPKLEKDATNRATALGDWLPNCWPCGCPKDCHCHLRHLTRLGISPASTTQIKKDLAGASLSPIAQPFTLATCPLANVGPQLNFPRETSALAVCARLCRFAS